MSNTIMRHAGGAIAYAAAIATVAFLTYVSALPAHSAPCPIVDESEDRTTCGSVAVAEPFELRPAH